MITTTPRPLIDRVSDALAPATLLVAVFAASIALAFVPTALKHAALLRHGRETVATITAVDLDWSRRGRHYLLVCRYRLDSQPAAREVRIPKPSAVDYASDETVTIVVDTTDPARAELETVLRADPHPLARITHFAAWCVPVLPAAVLVLALLITHQQQQRRRRDAADAIG